MATRVQKRRPALLAILLALLAAGALCIWAVAAAGFTISSPLVDSIAGFFGGGDGAAPPGAGTQVADTGSGGGGGGGRDDGGNGGGGDDGGNGGGGNGGGGGGQDDCLLGFLCLSAGAGADGDAEADNGQGAADLEAGSNNGNSTLSADVAGSGSAEGNQASSLLAVDASVEDDNTTCFLGLICFTAIADTAGATEPAGTALNAAASGADDGLHVDADSDADADADTEADEAGVAGDADVHLDADADLADEEENCLLGIICLDVNTSSNVGGGSSQAGFFEILWQAFVSLFAGVEVGYLFRYQRRGGNRPSFALLERLNDGSSTQDCQNGTHRGRCHVRIDPFLPLVGGLSGSARDRRAGLNRHRRNSYSARFYPLICTSR